MGIAVIEAAQVEVPLAVGGAVIGVQIGFGHVDFIQLQALRHGECGQHARVDFCSLVHAVHGDGIVVLVVDLLGHGAVIQHRLRVDAQQLQHRKHALVRAQAGRIRAQLERVGHQRDGSGAVLVLAENLRQIDGLAIIEAGHGHALGAVQLPGKLYIFAVDINVHRHGGGHAAIGLAAVIGADVRAQDAFVGVHVPVVVVAAALVGAEIDGRALQAVHNGGVHVQRKVHGAAGHVAVHHGLHAFLRIFALPVVLRGGDEVQLHVLRRVERAVHLLGHAEVHLVGVAHAVVRGEAQGHVQVGLFIGEGAGDGQLHGAGFVYVEVHRDFGVRRVLRRPGQLHGEGELVRHVLLGKLCA